MKSINYLFLLLIAVSITSCNLFSPKKVSFVKVEGTHFSIDKARYNYVGTNLWYASYLGAPNKLGDRKRLKKELDFLADLGVKNLRILGSSEASKLSSSLSPAVQPKLGEYNENLLLGLDFALAEMGKRNMRAVIFLNNYWEWSGGMGQYMAWIDSVDTMSPSDAPWPDYNKFMIKFYRHKTANKFYRKLIKKIVTRKNSVTGRYYFNDPTIMAWQLANEPRAGLGEEGEKHIEQFFKWIDETAGYIKSLDTNHLVTTGMEGTVATLDNENYFVKAHQSKNIDYATFHLWAKNWGWFKAKDAKATFPKTVSNAIDYVNKHVKLAKQIGKPIVLEEFGLPRDEGGYSPIQATSYRDKYFERILDTVFNHIKNDEPISGTNFWSWGGFGKAADKSAIWKPGDDFTGDPPQEPQGLNSVFSSDKSTIKVLKNEILKLDELNKLD